jgi:3-isopropylmalate/(R)-2-methylmalate dehydratase small subunit
MSPFTKVKGAAIPLLLSNVDTDVIIRIERMTALPRGAWGPYALEPLRYLADGSEDPDSVLNRPALRGAPVLLAGPNFGCGSSREPAVVALQEMGIRCVMAPSFGDIFFANCFQNGLLPIRLELPLVEAIAAQCADGGQVTVDLERCIVRSPDGREFPFEVDARRREALLEGLDDIGLTLKDEPLITAWQQADRLRRPWAWPQPLTGSSANRF